MAGIDDIFGGSRQYGYSRGDINQTIADRSAQIGDFSSQLAAMRSQYLAQIPGLQNAAFQRFGGDAAANFGAKGIGVDSGAFASALAREAIPMQAQMYGTAFNTGVNNLNAVNNAYQGMYQGAMGAESAGMSAPTANPLWAGLGNLAGTAATMYLRSKLFPGTPGDNPGSFTAPGSLNRPIGPMSFGGAPGMDWTKEGF